jgi:hypothetical protein
MLAQWAMSRWQLGADQSPTTVDFAVTADEDLDDDADTDLILAATPEDSIS